MNFDNLIKIDQIQVNMTAGSKKKVLEMISQIVTDCYPQYQTSKIFETLIERERLGSTGIGHGVALPHGRLAECQEPIGIFISLTDGIDFDAIDKQTVHLIFTLLVPENSTQAHLQILAKLAEFFRRKDKRQMLDEAASAEDIYQLLIDL